MHNEWKSTERCIVRHAELSNKRFDSAFPLAFRGNLCGGEVKNGASVVSEVSNMPKCKLVNIEAA